jgi:hypothetical protein
MPASRGIDGNRENGMKLSVDGANDAVERLLRAASSLTS